MVLLLFLFREASRATQTTDRNWAETTVLASTAEVEGVEGVEGEGKTMVTSRPETFDNFFVAKVKLDISVMIT